MTSFESSLVCCFLLQIEDGDIICFQKSTPLEIEGVSLSLHSVLDGDLQVKRSHPNAELRLLEVLDHKIYKIFPNSEKVENINYQYRTLRAKEASSFAPSSLFSYILKSFWFYSVEIFI
ncbi:hypothetical protein ACFXTH_008603 [Malus domestica]